MRKFIFIFFFSLFLLNGKDVIAVENPLSVSNNNVGIHILFPEEITDASKLVNSKGGDWGYVTIPIQSGDKDLKKWQAFMDSAKQNHVIPIIRLATEGDYFNTKVWRKPVLEDIVDFANFLGSLDWPTKNRYIVVYNEVNRGDEWGGAASPEQYAEILSYAASFFKYVSDDFFIISAGLDNAAPNKGSEYMNEYVFLRQMAEANPDVFKQIDGLGSHAYPNPGFSQPPTTQNQTSIASFRYEKQLIQSLGGEDLPVFITETGWPRNTISDTLASSYYKQAFENVWNDKDVVAVTPFLLKAGEGAFTEFSFLTTDGKPSEIYKSIEEMSKRKGTPTLAPSILGKKTAATQTHFIEYIAKQEPQKRPKAKIYANILYWFIGL